ncbi:MAG: 1-deoxy-D-xylulose-5-phosphate synthase [Puniceicoccales bacterium]|nr:1-deoxy-D-xylulose-5-phosphate synthase [Puniceicoccales bacterium]
MGGQFANEEALAAQLRRRIVAVVERNGGHLASNLGIVELTIALHRSFSLPHDRLIFDVSHQCYAHKLLTGRDGMVFDRLRREGGCAGFCDGAECGSDPFLLGHAGTALSAALGMAVARDRLGGREQIVAILGDGSLTCGLSLEALQHVASQTNRLIVVINDNGQTIDPSVGSLAQLLASPRGGRHFFCDVHGFNYLGPIDGHSFAELIPTFAAARHASGPVLVHVRTVKGKGHPAAEADPVRHHKFSPLPEQSPYAAALGKTLCSQAEQLPNLVAVTAAMAGGTGLRPFAARFPSRFFDVGIAEGHAVTFAAGLARGGMRPVCAIYSSFFQRAVDNFFHDICLQDLPVIFFLDNAGPACGDGDTHHGLFDIALTAAFPNVVLAQPASPDELSQLLGLALQTPHPFLIRHGRNCGENAPLVQAIGSRALCPGMATVLRQGRQISLWALGQRRVEQALEIATFLEKDGIGAEVVHARFVRPLDRQQLQLSAGSGLLVTLEDHVVPHGFGSRIALELAAIGSPCRLLSIGWPFPIGFAENFLALERRWQQTPRDIFRRILQVHATRASQMNNGGEVPCRSE